VRLLLVDDSSVQLGTLTALLQMHGHEVHAFHSGEAALRAVADGLAYDAAVVDVLMPGMRGCELYYKLPNVLCVTALPEGTELHHGDCQVLRKPFDVKELEAKLKEVVHGKPVDSDSAADPASSGRP
jgi:DNA-binding response OmpR family regulator